LILLISHNLKFSARDQRILSTKNFKVKLPSGFFDKNVKSSQVKSSQVVGLRDRVAITRTLIFSFHSYVIDSNISP